MFLLLTLVLLSGCSGLKFDRASVFAGGLYSPLTGPDLVAETQGVRLDMNLNRTFGASERFGRLDLGAEVYGSVVTSPEPGHMTGITPFLRYSFPLTDWLRPFIEGGAGPVLLSFPTHEQEKAGFNFNDQIGAGVELRLGSRLSLVLGYRFGHISHAGLRSTRNRGIDYHAGLGGLVIKLP